MNNPKNLISKADKLQQSGSPQEPPALQAKRRVIPYYIAAALLLPVGLAQSWFAFGRRSVAYELPQLEKQITAIKSDMDQAHMDSEALQSPKRIGMLAHTMGFAVPVTPPVIVPPSDTAPSTEALESATAQMFRKKPEESKTLLPLPWGISSAVAGEPKTDASLSLTPAEEGTDTR